MANDTSIRESDILSLEYICHEVDSRSSQVTVPTKSERCPSLQSEDASMSESHEIPEVPGRHKITTCKDVCFFATASATHEAILSSSSDSQTSNTSGATEADDAATGTEDHSSSNILPLKNAARVSDLFRSGTEGNSHKGQTSTLEGRESGISINESLLLSVDLTTADLGTICDVNDKNYYQQMVLRSLLAEDHTDQCDSERSNAPGVASALAEDKDGQEVQNIDSENVVSLPEEDAAGYEKELERVKIEERTSKFRFLDVYCSSQDVFVDAKGSNGKNSDESLPAGQDLQESIVKEFIVNDVLNSALQGASIGDYDETHDQSFSGMSAVSDSKNICGSVDETDTHLPKFSSGDNSVLSVHENEIITRQGEEPPSMEKDRGIHVCSSDSAPCLLLKSDRSLKNRSVLAVEALFRAGAENSVVAVVRAGLCFTAVFIILYAPSTLINILTLYLQLLVCAIFVDIFLN